MIFPRKHQYVSGASYGVVFFGLAIAAIFAGITCTAVAGDLLRGGYTASRSGSTVPGSFTSPSATQLRQNANDVLARTTTAIQSVIAMQSAAHKIAAKNGNTLGIPNPNNPSQNLPTVTEGLSTGGLYPTGGIASLPAGWTGVKSLAQTQSGNDTTVTVTQNSPDAVLTWQSFNVGKSTTLDFNQSAGGANESKWIAFNIVQGSSIAPSQILGNINAGGQVYVINQNGIIFGGASQVNVHALVASSLPLNMNLVSRGLLNNPDAQFLFSALSITAGPNGTPAFTPPAAPASGDYGDVTVEAGATIVSPASVDNVGGRVALVGANVTNAGTIYTPDGQTILAAGLQVGFVAHPSDDPSLRGLDVYVGQVGSYAGTATNDGLIEVPEGNITITGKTVDQLGALDSNTTVSLNGRIDLLADYDSVAVPISTSGNNTAAGSTGGIRNLSPFQFLPESAGIVELGPNSVTQILPDVESTATVVPTQTLAQASVNIQGNVIHMESDSTILAPSAAVNLDTGAWVVSPGANPETNFIHSTGQIYLDAGAEIDAAGSTDVPASVTQNIVSAQLRGAELENDPLQRNGPLRGQTIAFDIRQQGAYGGTAWIGSPLANLFAYASLVQQTIGELTINGGTVTMNAGGSIVMQPGSSVDVSGGYINYAGGVVRTTQVLSASGQIYNIAQATPDIIYQGIFTGQFTVDHPTYGITNTFTDPILGGAHYEDGYLYGGNAGQILITAPSVAMDGALTANTVTGPRQLSLGPTPGTLSITFQAQAVNAANDILPVTPAVSPKVVIESGVELTPVGPFSLDSSGNPIALPADRQSEVVLSPGLTSQDGFGVVTINNDGGDVVVPAGVSWNGPAVLYADSSGNEHPASITVNAANIDIEGSITVPGGYLAFTSYDINPITLQLLKASAGGLVISPPAVPGQGNFVLGANASIDASGLIVDNRLDAPEPETLPIVTAGGTVAIDSFSANLEAGGIINVSGGVEVSPTGKFTYGRGGSIAVEAGADPGISSVLGGHLFLGSTLEGYSGAVGGSLTIQAQLVQIGGDSSNPGVLLLSPDLFAQGGFSSFTIYGIGGTDASKAAIPAVLIAPGTQISSVVTNALALQDPANPSNLVMVPELFPVGSRSAASLKFAALGAVDQIDNSILIERGDFVLGAGAQITTDPQGSVSISGNTVAILGSVIVPAGTISVSAKNNAALLLTHPTTAQIDLDLAPGSLLSTAGTTVATPNAYGYQTGNVLPGGAITVFGNILAESGAVLDVSGATGVFDLPQSFSNLQTAQTTSFAGKPFVPTRIDSNGGSITLQGDQELFTDATLLGFAGGPSAVGGSLTVGSGHFYSLNGTQPKLPTDITMVVTQSGPVIPGNFTATGQAAIGLVVTNPSGTEITGGNFAVNDFEQGGFDNLFLPGTVQFKGSTSINARGEVAVGNGGFIYGDGTKSSIDITASYVVLGQAFQTPQPGAPETSVFTNYVQPTYGLTSLTVTADLIDIGNLSLQDIGNANFIANNGDIRGDGTLDIQGTITMRAGQIYPPTETTFSIAAYDYSVNGATQPGSITIIGSGIRDLPLSAGGTLNLYATVINQGGALRAPMGTINLGWDGQGTGWVDPLSGESAPVTQKVTLEKGSVTSVSAVDPTTGQGIAIPYGINLNGKQWIDPTGTNITAGGVPTKSINISAQNVDDQHGALIDLSGGGDLFSYDFIPGLGGSTDILASTSSYAVIPGYQAQFAPFAPYFNGNAINPNLSPTVVSTSVSNLGGDSGYTNSTLKVGSQIYLTGVNGLRSGFYTLLPARYALLPGAFLVTPQATSTVPPASPVALPDGSFITTGYTGNALDPQSAQPLVRAFEVQSQAVVNHEAEYDPYYGNSFLLQGAINDHVSVPRLPEDAGQLVLQATQSMTIEGQLASSVPAGGLQSLVDISSPVGIEITGPNASGGAGSGELVLNSSALSAFATGSLLVGGVRVAGADGTVVDVATPDITVDGGAVLVGSDIILAANTNITVDSGAQIESAGAVSNSDPSLTVNGNGVLLRVGGNLADTETRAGVTQGNSADMVISGGAKISGASVTLDSSAGTSLDPTAVIQAHSLSLSSGQITVELNNPGSVPAITGLVLTENVLKTLQSGATSLSLLSYSTLDFYGAGQIGATSAAGKPTLGSLSINAGEIQGFNNNGGTVTLAAQKILLANSADASNSSAVPIAASAGLLAIDGGTIELGANQLNVDQFSTVALNATGGILAVNTGLQPDGVTVIDGGLSANGAMDLTAPLITGQKGTVETFAAAGALQISLPSKSSTVTVASGLGASLIFDGASIADSGDIAAPTGSLTLEAQTGDLVIGNQHAATLSAAGTSEAFFDLTKYTGGGAITLIADKGNISIGAGSTVSVAAPSQAGNGGTLLVSAPDGSFTAAGTLAGQAGAGGKGGSFSLDVSTLPTLSAIDASLDQAGFTNALTFRVRSSDVTIDGVADAQNFTLSTDSGSIDVVGTINASGNFGGTITLYSSNNITLEQGSDLNASAQNYDDAGKGGAVSLETTGGTITINGEIDLGVKNAPAGPSSMQDVTGTLYLRAPQIDGGGNIAATPTSGVTVDIAPITGAVNGASSIILEGYYAQTVDAPTAAIDTFESTALTNAASFMANAATITTQVAGNSGLAIQVRPGEEIDNTGGDLVLENDWNLATARFGPNADPSNNPGSGLPGTLTLRAAGNLIFDGALSDGFNVKNSPDGSLWQAPLLPAGSLSWSYNLVAGANFTSANYQTVLPVADIPSTGASLELGLNDGPAIANKPGLKATTSSVIQGFFQVIRTGVGNINIATAGDVDLLNQFATIYTAGAQVADPGMNGTFDLPVLSAAGPSTNPLGTVQESTPYPAQYTYGGGNISIDAQGNIQHLTENTAGQLVPDSEKELPINWLYRRGYVDSAGVFGTAHGGDIASTTWWVDFSNFFEGVGALGGGNVTMVAGGSINNVDAVIPTNARMPMGAPNASSLVQLGGGDLVVHAGDNINAGVYYVEQGAGSLSAGGSITTNPTRSPSLGAINSPATIADSNTWLPTTLFLGNGSFTVTANDDLLLGPVANVFLLPEGYSNTYWYKTYFSTYGAADSVDVSSLTGNVTLRESATLPAVNALAEPLLMIWLDTVSLLSTASGAQSVSDYQPWLRLDETSIVGTFDTDASILPPTLRATAYSGNINIVGNLTLDPAPGGTLQLAAADSINGLQDTGLDINSGGNHVWVSTQIDVSDANPGLVPQVTSPFAYQSLVGTARTSYQSGSDFLQFIANLFNESGSLDGQFAVLQTQQDLNYPGILHASDAVPLQVYAASGDISGITLFSPKQARVLAGTDITDVALYIQNTGDSSLSIVSAGRDILPYDAAAPLLLQAQSPGNELGIAQAPLVGDIQVSGPGTLEVLAGHDLTLGESAANADPTLGLGITSVGNARNPYLPFNGASIITAAGMGSIADGLSGSVLDFKTFATDFLTSALGSQYFSDLSQTDPAIQVSSIDQFDKLSKEQQDVLALDIFYIVLRDAGRDHNLLGSPGYGNYSAGMAAIAALFSSTQKLTGDMDLTSREIKTESGGDINILVPGGLLTVGVETGGNAVDQGILTQYGGNISIFANGSVNVGTSRIFTLRGGNEIIWSMTGNIDAGASSKTVQSAPPTRVLIDPQSGDVETDLAGLATGGGIGVLATVADVAPGSVDLIAPTGTIDAGDAGIRATGNLNLAAVQVLNASNIQSGGASSGVPVVVAAAPNLGALTAATAAVGAGAAAANGQTQNPNNQSTDQNQPDSIFDVQVIGYGGGDVDSSM